MIRVTEEELTYYASLERAVYALQFYLQDCRHPGWCACKYELRRLVNELATRIDLHRAQTLVQILPKALPER